MDYIKKILIILVIFSSLLSLIAQKLETESDSATLIYFPLDERFATRGMFINMMQIIENSSFINSFQTPSKSIISQYKTPANLTELYGWLNDTTDTFCNNSKCIFILSSELFLYGGLITSRTSNDTFEIIQERLNYLKNLKLQYGNNLKIYISNVIMRIPAYNEDVEEPWYWAIYGYQLYEYSYYLDEYYVTSNESALDKANSIKSKIPENIVDKFLWRRQRNYNVTVQMLQYQQQYNLFENIWITLDDNSLYGLSKYDERNLQTEIENLNLTKYINMYPGADEVGLSMLSRSFSSLTNTTTQVSLFYRNSTSRDFIPNYEGQPLNLSVLQQIFAAGGLVINNDDKNSINMSQTNVMLLLNNFDAQQQQESTVQQTAADYSIFLNLTQNFENIIGFADVRYSNGGDTFFGQFIDQNFQQKFGLFAYAGWNTDGNKLGTVICNSILMSIIQVQNNQQQLNYSSCQNQIFTYYRFLEDIQYQAKIRQDLENYIDDIALGDTGNLTDHYNFYSNFVNIGLNAQLKLYQNNYQDYSCQQSNQVSSQNLYFPWNRIFEIGFDLTSVNSNKQQQYQFIDN